MLLTFSPSPPSAWEQIELWIPDGIIDDHAAQMVERGVRFCGIRLGIFSDVGPVYFLQN